MLEVVKNGNKEYATEIPYSTTEKRIGIWIDGKPLYRKVIKYNPASVPIGASGTITNIEIPHNISNLKRCVNCRAFQKDLEWQFPYLNGSDNTFKYTLVSNVNNTIINLRIFNDTWRATEWNFILEYTKTTD